MNNEAARWMLKEIDERISKRKRPLDFVTTKWLERVRQHIEGGFDLPKNDETQFSEFWGRMTDPARLKWGNAVRPL